jgi:tetraprenyl-beta-curcumene synthase
VNTAASRRPLRPAPSPALVRSLGLYWGSIFPLARAEVRRWRRRAERIPDPVLRAHARETLAGEHRNAESAAVFALLAARANREAVVRLLVGYQLMYDYLDTLSEQPAGDPLANGRQLHRALSAAVSPGAAGADYYAHHGRGADGGYLAELVAACAGGLAGLPSGRLVEAGLLRSVALAAESQSRNHAAMLSGEAPALARWAARATPRGSDLRWWETAAAAGSSLATHALLAAAGDPALTGSQADRIERAYWPWVNALNTLLESLADQLDDAASGNHSYVSHYGSGVVMALRLATISAHAARATRGLPRHDEHALVLAGMVAFYLAAPGARTPQARPAADAVRRELGPLVGALVLMLRVQSRIG